MGANTRIRTALLCGALTAAWSVPAWAQEPSRPSVQRPSGSVATPEPEVEQTEPPSDSSASDEPPIVEPPIDSSTPALEGGLPSYEAPIVEAPIVELPPPREVPRDGRGRLTVGSIAVAGGAAAFAGTIALAANGIGFEVWGGTLLLGTGATLLGGFLLAQGRRRLLAYREWEAAQPEVVPRQGHGLVASGSALVIGGAAGAMIGTIVWMTSSFGYRDPSAPRPPPIPQTMFGVGLGSLALGTTLLVVGMSRHKRFLAWRDNGTLARMQLVPGFAPLRGGGQIGLSGRF